MGEISREQRRRQQDWMGQVRGGEYGEEQRVSVREAHVSSHVLDHIARTHAHTHYIYIH